MSARQIDLRGCRSSRCYVNAALNCWMLLDTSTGPKTYIVKQMKWINQQHSALASVMSTHDYGGGEYRFLIPCLRLAVKLIALIRSSRMYVGLTTVDILAASDACTASKTFADLQLICGFCYIRRNATCLYLPLSRLR